MFTNTTLSSRSSSSCSRNSSMPSLRMRNPLSPKTSYNPLFRHSDALTSFDASHFVFQEQRRKDKKNPVLRRYHSHDSHHSFDDPRDTKDDTPDSTKSRGSTGSESGHEYEARDFLERYSLPRVVRVGGGEPLLLYRCFDSFTKIQARGIVGRKGKEKADGNVLHFPEGYSGRSSWRVQRLVARSRANFHTRFVGNRVDCFRWENSQRGVETPFRSRNMGSV
jgi:hypothetical protein